MGLVCVTYLITANLKNEPNYQRHHQQHRQQEERYASNGGGNKDYHNYHNKRHNGHLYQPNHGHNKEEDKERHERQEQKRKQHNMNNLDAENVPPPPQDDESGEGGNGGGIFGLFRGKHGKYRHSDYLNHIGDHSVHYAQLRQKYDELLPHQREEDVDRMREYVDALKKNEYKNMMGHEMDYDIHDCPDYPPPNYPYAWNVRDVLDNWPPDDTFEIRSHIYQGLCTFDYDTEYHKAINYREAEVPFVVQNDPKVMRTAERWNQPNYLMDLLGDTTHYRTEFSPNNHFMYWNKPGKKQRQNGNVPENWKPPTKMGRMKFPKWLEHANVTDEELLQPDHEHWYFRLIGCGEMGDCDKDSSEFLFDELGFFQPTDENELYMVEPRKQKGIHCRFGMKGVIAENHFDGSRNMIAVLGGERRYILSHPNQCENLVLLPRGHPSARHSAVDWSDPDWETFPDFAEAEVNEVVLQAGDVLYLPTNWFHYIISLDMNYQCNTRSGINNEYMDAIRDCGF